MLKKLRKFNKWSLILILLMVVIVAVLIRYDWASINSYQQYNTTTLQYVKAQVVTIESESLSVADYDNDLYLGSQTLTVEVLEGDFEGEQFEVENYLTSTHNIEVSEGQYIIICIDDPDSTDPYITVYNYYRHSTVIGIIIAFMVVMMVVGGIKGIKSAIGLLFAFGFIMGFMMPAIYHGFSPVLVSIITAGVITIVSLLFLNGFSKKTMAAIIATTSGVILSGIIFAVISKILHISGYQIDEAESLIMVTYNTGLQIREILFAGVLISSLGAVMDIAVSISSAIYEISILEKDYTKKELIRSGLNIGKDIIGTMSNTLILAFVGGSIGTVLAIMSYGFSNSQILSSDYVAVEIATGLSATMGVILTVPIVSVVCGYIFTGHSDKKIDK